MQESIDLVRLARALALVAASASLAAIAPGPVAAQDEQSESDDQPSGPAEQTAPAASSIASFTLGEMVTVLGDEDGGPGIGGSTVAREQLQLYERNTLDQAVNLLPGVVSTFDANGRRNETDIFVRGFGRWQVPLLIDGIRIYLPADNRLDFGRFLTVEVAAIQVQKGYASVLDGPGAMGGAINLVTVEPKRRLSAEAGASAGGRGFEGATAWAILGTRRPKLFAQASAAISDRDSWSLSADYEPPPNSLQGTGERIGSDHRDWRLNLKVGAQPTASNQYTLNHTRQAGEKGAPLNVFNNPPVPPNSYWRWPQWDVESTSLLTTTQLGAAAYLEAKAFYNAFANLLDAFDDATYTTQSLPGRFRSPYDDHAWGASFEAGASAGASHTVKAAVHARTDVHREQQTNRPTNPAARFTEPLQEQAQDTWSLAIEDTWSIAPSIDLVAGVSYDDYRITRAEDWNTARGLFEYPHGSSHAFNWQAALVWRRNAGSRWHASVSDRARFPVIFELYSTRFGTATPNPDLGPERGTNLEVGWRRTTAGGARWAASAFYSDVRDLIQTVVLRDATTQSQNVGDGQFAGVELSADAPLTDRLLIGGHYTYIDRTVDDPLRPDLRATGVPRHRGFVYASWRPTTRLRLTPSFEAADDRWSERNPAPAFPYVRTGAHTLLAFDATHELPRGVELSLGFHNLLDDDYQLAWGYPQPGRTFYLKWRLLR